MTPVEFLLAKMALSARFRFRETSGYRCKEANDLVGGSANSQHQFWLGTDLILWMPTDQSAFVSQAARFGLSVIDEGDHLHVQPVKWIADA